MMPAKHELSEVRVLGSGEFGLQLNLLVCDMEHATEPELEFPGLYKMVRVTH